MSKQLKKQTSVTEDNRGKTTLERHEFYSGIVPSADELAKYEDICEGFADRLISIAEFEQRERIKLQNKIVDDEKVLRLTGLS